MFIGKYNKSVILTYIGLATAAGGIFLSVEGLTKWAFIALIIAGICDLFDGSLARKVKRDEDEKEFGVQIDSLVDVISFGVLPIVLMYSMGLKQWYHVCILILYLLCAVIRLAYFNVYRLKDGFYTGLPVTFSALILTLLYSITCLTENMTNILFTVGMAALSLLFILNIKIKKPGGKWYAVFGIMAMIFIVLILWKG